MKNLLYLGNKLSVHGNTVTGIEVLGPLLESEGYKVRYASSKKGKLARLIDMLVTLWRHGRKSDYVLIDTYSTLNFWYAYLCARWCRRNKVKYIPILHGGNLPRRLRKSPGMCQNLFGDAYINIAPSPYLGKVFSEAGFNVKYIPNPVDFSKFSFKERREIGPSLLWVRSLARIYNPMMALETLKIVRQHFPDAKLCMVGPDKEKLLPRLKAFADQYQLNVSFKGRMSKSEWGRLSRDYDIFLNTAKIDNAPFSLLEAAALGLYIVSNNVGGIPHLLRNRENALLTIPGDAKSMAGAIKELIDDSELRSKLTSNRVELLKKYEWDTIRVSWGEVFRVL